MTSSRNRNAKKPIIAFTMGDFNGIGPEIILRTIRNPAIRRIAIPVIIGSMGVFSYYATRLRFKVLLRQMAEPPDSDRSPGIPVIDVMPHRMPHISPGRQSVEAGIFAGLCLRHGVTLALHRTIDAIVTAPTSKEVMHSAGYQAPGQTELIRDFCGCDQSLMMLSADSFRVVPATIHVPLRQVARRLTGAGLRRTLRLTHEALRKDYGISSPRIAVLGLNPHAGENGILGSEEREVISPAISSVRRRGILAEGPFAADGFFGVHAEDRYDAVVSMYHDQGLIPLKMRGFAFGVNATAGLPVIRTSPDHGTAFSLAGKGVADPGSMIAAARLAVEIAQNRRRRNG